LGKQSWQIFGGKGTRVEAPSRSTVHEISRQAKQLQSAKKAAAKQAAEIRSKKDGKVGLNWGGEKLRGKQNNFHIFG